MSEKEYIFVGNAQLKTRDYIKQLEKENKQLHSIIKEVRKYIENNSLYYQEEEYDYEDNLVLGEPDDTDAKNDILEILDKENI